MDAVLVIRADLVEQMVAHARRDHPVEACGQLLGPEGSDRPERYVPMTNTDAVASDYAFDSREQLRVHREAEERDEEPVVVFHSHTRVPRRPLTDTGLPEAYPSEKDIQYMALQPGVHFVIVALTGPESGYDLRSYLLDEAGDVVEDDVQVVGDAETAGAGPSTTYMFAHTGADDVPDRG